MPEPDTFKAIDHAIQVMTNSQLLFLMCFNDTPKDLEGVGRKAVLGKHVRELEDTLRELRRLARE